MAENSRFPHSLGVCYLASRSYNHQITQVIENPAKQLDHLVEQWVSEGNSVAQFPATNEEMMCVEIAALCHDLVKQF